MYTKRDPRSMEMQTPGAIHSADIILHGIVAQINYMANDLRLSGNKYAAQEILEILIQKLEELV